MSDQLGTAEVFLDDVDSEERLLSVDEAAMLIIDATRILQANNRDKGASRILQYAKSLRPGWQLDPTVEEHVLRERFVELAKPIIESCRHHMGMNLNEPIAAVDAMGLAAAKVQSFEHAFNNPMFKADLASMRWAIEEITHALVDREHEYLVKRGGRPRHPGAQPIVPNSLTDPHFSLLCHNVINQHPLPHPVYDQMLAHMRLHIDLALQGKWDWESTDGDDGAFTKMINKLYCLVDTYNFRHPHSQVQGDALSCGGIGRPKVQLLLP